MSKTLTKGQLCSRPSDRRFPLSVAKSRRLNRRRRKSVEGAVGADAGRDDEDRRRQRALQVAIRAGRQA